MTDKTLNARMVQKHDIEAHWKLAENFVPKLGEVIVYDPDENCSYSRIKVGDGVTLVNSLPFSTPTAENIETALGYVPAKMPKYEQPDWGAEKEIVTLYSGQLLCENLIDNIIMWMLSDFELTEGQTYTVNIDGNTWERTAAKFNEMPYIGNTFLAGNGDGMVDSGEPFLLAYSPVDNVVLLVVQQTDTIINNGYINFTLTIEGDIYHKIPSEYIEGIGEKIKITVSDFAKDATVVPPISFEEAWTIDAEELGRAIEVVKEGETNAAASVKVVKNRDTDWDTNVIYIFGNKYGTSALDAPMLYTFIITWYEIGFIGINTYQHMLAPDGASYGDYIKHYDDRWISVSPEDVRNDILIPATTSTLGAVKVGEGLEIDSEGTLVCTKDFPTSSEPHQMFVTDADGNVVWEERTHYSAVGEVTVIPETTYTINLDEGGIRFPEVLEPTLVVGGNYTTTIDGTVFNSTAYNTTFEGLEFIAIGNAGFVGGTDTGESYIMLVLADSGMTDSFGAYGMLVIPGAESATVSIT